MLTNGKAAMRDRPRRQRIAAATPPNRLTTQRRVAAGWAAMRMGATMMRHGSDQYLPAAMSGMIICMLLLGAILVRSVGLADVIMVGRRGNRQHLADRLDPVSLAMIVDEGDHGLNRRSSSAWAK